LVFLKNKKRHYYFGIAAELIAAAILIMKGYRIVRRRYKTKFGEIDIIAKKSNMILVVEVKARSSKIIVEEVLNKNQIHRIKNAVQFFISQNANFQNLDVRFDFIEVNKFLFPRHYTNFIS
jgi:putative endonuclease